MKLNRLKFWQSGGIIVAFVALILLVGAKYPSGMGRNWLGDYSNASVLPNDTTKDTTLPYPPNPNSNGGLYLNNPANFGSNVEYDPETGEYVIQDYIGGVPSGLPRYLSTEEYQDYIFQKQIDEYWKQKSQSAQATGSEDPGGLLNPIEINSPNFDRIFGSNVVQIRPNGAATLSFAGVINRTDNPALSERQRRTANFDFDEEIRMNVIGQVGDKLKLQTNYDTKAQFEFQNQMKLEYTGTEDEIIKKIELGNVSLPLTGSLISGAQSLFGIKTQLQFGRATITSVYSEQKSETQQVEVEGGARTSEFELRADQYEANKHYFLSQYFRDNYNNALSNLPIINSGVNITKVEVWITNRNGTTQGTRNVIGYMDLGESGDNIHNSFVTYMGGNFPDNTNNILNPADFTSNYPGVRDLSTVNGSMPTQLELSTDYEKIENARMLNPNEYSVNDRLGYITLNQSLNADEVLTVAYQYTINGQTFQVGEFSTDGVDAPQVLQTKLLKATITNVNLPLWDLMMKNIYNIGAYQVNREDFRLDVLYANDETGTPINYLPEGPPDVKNVVLLKVLNLDNLNTNNDPQPDGVFDFLNSPVITINSQNGRVYFPVVEPFGDYLAEKLDDEDLVEKYVYQELYDSTLAAAQQVAQKNKFFLSGSYKSSSSSDIRLNAINIPQGSVKVTAGGRVLTENEDYTVDYTLGSVKILNEGLLSSGQKITVSLESANIYNFQTRRFMGSHIDYRINKDFILGASVLNLTERPITQKITTGEEPISNTIWGLNGSYTTESPFLTALVDYIPLIDTKEKSTITVSGEFAQIIPGHPKAIEQDNTGTSYVDDFEGSESAITLKAFQAWVLASTPQGQPNLFPEAQFINQLDYGYNRAKLAWYTIDQIFWRNDNITPDNIANNPDEQAAHPTRQVFQQEIWPNKAIQQGFSPQQPTLDLAYYPTERGPYNFDVEGTPGISAGLNQDGSLAEPETRWAGVMRRITTNDFEAANVEFIEFWMLDPFIDDPAHQGGDLYFNLGNVSEDILKDSRKAFENGLPTGPEVKNVDTTIWGRVPTAQSLVQGFDATSENSRQYQDIGLDGLNDVDERKFKPYEKIDSSNRETYLERIANHFGSSTVQAYNKAFQDPAADNFHYYRGNDYDDANLGILERYKQFNGLERNSPTSDQMPDGLSGASNSQLPNVEDINADHTLTETEAYYQYKVSLRPQDLQVGKNFIVDKVTANVEDNPNPAVWYQFRVPIRQPDKIVGNISDFRSIRFIRMFLKEFEDPVVCRFATLDLIRGDWRKYTADLRENQEIVIEEPNDNTLFNISSVNIEENGARTPINYVLPPGIEREVLFGTTALQSQNEQSMVLEVCDLEDGDGRSAFKNVNLDMRTYRSLKMFVHAEAVVENELQNDEVSCFVRIGSDFSSNYYEYEVPLKVTQWGASSREDVWPSANNMDIEFSDLQTVKQQRNDAIRFNPNISRATPFTVQVDNKKITVVGSPNLSNIRTIMIGVRNPAAIAGNGDDGMPKCAEVWVNELRLTDFDERGGWAANARVTAKLADFARVNVAGSMSTVGFGSIEKSVTERSKEEVKQYSASSNVELGKFFPEKAGVTIPLYLSVSEQMSDPQFNPLDPDIPLDAALDAQPTVAERDSLKRIVQDYTKQRSFNLTNVRKQRTGNNKARVYDIENFSASYAYTEMFRRNINTEYAITKTYRGGLGYNFSTTPKNIKPLANIEAIRTNKNLRILRDFNFYLMPSRFSVRADVDRYYSEQQLRNTNNANLIIQPNFNKSFNFNRVYDLKYDLARSLKLDFSATMNARVDEPEGAIETKSQKDSIRESFFSFGRPIAYNHTTGITWNTPINKLPYLDFASLNVRYTANYNWNAASLATPTFGNTIQNSQSFQYNGQMNMNTLYNKFKVFRELNRNSRGGGRGNPRGGRGRSSEAEANESADDGAEINIGQVMLKLVSSIKTVSMNYQETRGTLLPGYMPSVDIMGADKFGTPSMSPNLGFLFGQQRDEFGAYAAGQGWLTTDTLMNQQLALTNTKNLTLRSSVEPFRNFRLELNANKTSSLSHNEFFRVDNQGFYTPLSPTERGNFNISFISWRTAFVKDNDDNESPTFEQFKNNRFTIARRLATQHLGGNYPVDPETGYPEGYGPSSQEVLIPAFLAAYSGNDAGNYTTSPFPRIPKPNWRITFDGFNQIDFFKERFRTVSLSHAYRSSYSVGNFQTNLLYEENSEGFPIAQDNNGNFINEHQISVVSISEQFSPLLKIDVTMKNDVQANVELKRDRTLSLSLTNGQLNETVGQEYVIGGGYRIKDVAIRIGPPGGRKRKITSDLNLKGDFTIRDNKVVSRRIDPEENLVTSGFITMKVSLYADYVINQRLNVRLFYERNVREPRISNSFTTANTNVGIRIQFTLAG